ncbi:hypothetical protein DL771_001874 [Monosporascus sp. 5C6A]|nr:hypothetical protein DL771_001874 [Monosporascus sp. 5C6A]
MMSIPSTMLTAMPTPENLPQLLDDAVHPPECYRRTAVEVNVSDFDTQDYSRGTDSSTRSRDTGGGLQPGEEGWKMKGIKTRGSPRHELEGLPSRLRESCPREARPETESADAQGTLSAAVLALWLTFWPPRSCGNCSGAQTEHQRRENRCMTIVDLNKQSNNAEHDVGLEPPT